MNKLYIFFLLITFFLAGCTNNSDESGGTDPDPEFTETNKPLSVQNITGKWEVYNFTKTVNSGTPLRYVDIDGFTITFNADNTFSEANARGDLGNKGEYEISRSDSITFRFKNEDQENDTTGYIVTLLSDKRLVTLDSYFAQLAGSSAVFRVKDLKFWRNLATMPTGHPGVTKEDVTIERLQGQWEIYSFREYIGGSLANDNAEKEALFKGVTYLFNLDKTYKEFGKSGGLSTQGTFVIVDDVVHLFDNAQEEGANISYTVWITNWVNDEFVFYHITMEVVPGSTQLRIRESFTNLRRKAS
ncbi:hypothetical protein [Dysgonomonas sp. ZJ279]|uniref:hypothetical protein n=1 Tax=Dysgonomonas sp. ZJ279 TaxID=2709796 RepID=UPI0013EDDF5C|nr:hypothetical protein [Dysgonomonas sp. ZJ279]